MRLTTAAIVTLILAASLALAQNAVHEVVLDDFEGDTLDRWQNSATPEYYRGGEGNEKLSFVDDPDRGRVMRAAIGFGDEHKSEPIWITRQVDEPFAIARTIRVSFWYKITGATEPPINSFILRLRTSPTAHSNYEILLEDGPPLDVWTQVTVDVRAGLASTRNIYGSIFASVKQVTLRLDDIDDHNAQFDLLVDDLVVTLDQARAESYEPTRLDLRRDDRLDVLVITHSAAGYYNIKQAARALDPNARVDTYLFRGLHFPLWGFPESVDELLGYDVIALVDVDPWCMTTEQASWLANLVRSGAAMIVFGGPNTLTHAHDFKLPLREALPVDFETDAKDLGGGTPGVSDDPLLAALPGPRLGTVASMHDLTPRDGAQVALSVGDRPLIVRGESGDGRVAVVNAWTSLGSSPRSRFFTADLSDDLMRSLLRWAADRQPGARLTAIELPPPSVVVPAQVTIGATAEGAARIRLLVEGQPEQVAPATGPVVFAVDLPARQESERTVACRVEALDAAGEVADWRDFAIELQNPLAVGIAWAAHQRTFAPGGAVELSVKLSRRDMPGLTAGGASLNLDFGEELTLSASGLGDIWVIPAGSDKTLHDQSGPIEVETSQASEGLLPIITTTGITRAGRKEMSFGDDDRIQRVERVASAQADGSVRITSRYEFLQDVRVDHIRTMLVLPAPTYAGLPFVALQGDQITDGELPVADGKKIFDGTGLKLTIETARGPLTIEVLDPSLHVWMQDLRRYGMDGFRLEIESPFEGKQARAGDTYEVPVLITGPPASTAPTPALADMTVACALLDPAGDTPVMQFPAREASAATGFVGELPDLRSGEYEMLVTVAEEGRIVTTATSPVYVVDPLNRADLFPIMSIVGGSADGHRLDEAGLRDRIDDLHAHGFNTVTAGNARTLARAGAGSTLGSDYAQRQGMAVFFEYHGLTLVGRTPVKPCVFDPAHRERLREKIEPQFDVCRRVARLLSIKILDEPGMARKNIDFCDRCRAQFRERYGVELPTDEQLTQDVAARWRMADFLGYYLQSAYAMTREIKDEGGGDYDLLLTFNSPGLGYGRGWTSRQDILSWGAEAGMMDFDIYPYFYPKSQKVRMVQCDYGLSMIREFARHLDMPWGFYVELDDRNWPYQQNPKEASGECAWTAVAQGADYLNSFIHRAFGTGVSSRPERWEFAGQELRKISRIGPLLTRMSRPIAPLAMIYPMGQAMVNDGSPPADYALECLRNSFGMTDAVSSEVIADADALADREAYVLLGCDILERDVADKLIAFCAAGGRLILDRVPTTSTDGAPLNLPWSFEGVAAQSLPGLEDCPYRVRDHVVMLDFDLNQEYLDAVEEDQFERAAALRQGIGALLAGTSSCFADDQPGQMEAGLRTCKDAAIVIAVNHLADENSATLRINSLGFEPTWACDLATMQPVAIEPGGTIPVTLAGRNSIAIALLPETPVGVDLSLLNAALKPGGALQYRVRVLNAEGNPARGCHLAEIEVTGPDGEVVSRFGGSTATEAGVLTREIPVPVNALPGEYRIAVRAPQANAQVEARFTVTP
jgi:uncharacterized membrane protein